MAEDPTRSEAYKVHMLLHREGNRLYATVEDLPPWRLWKRHLVWREWRRVLIGSAMVHKYAYPDDPLTSIDLWASDAAVSEKPTTVNVHVAGSLVSERDIVEAVRRAQLRHGRGFY